jgi:hypothetical protein
MGDTHASIAPSAGCCIRAVGATGPWEGSNIRYQRTHSQTVHACFTAEMNEMPHFIQQQVRGQNTVVEVLVRGKLEEGVTHLSFSARRHTPPLHHHCTVATRFPPSFTDTTKNTKTTTRHPFVRFQFRLLYKAALPRGKTCGESGCLSVPDALSLTIRRLFVCNVGFSLAVVNSIQR